MGKYVDFVVSAPIPPIVDALDSESDTSYLSANQGRILKQMVDTMSDPTISVIDDLTSGGRDIALSANMGRVLASAIRNNYKVDILNKIKKFRISYALQPWKSSVITSDPTEIPFGNICYLKSISKYIIVNKTGTKVYIVNDDGSGWAVHDTNTSAVSTDGKVLLEASTSSSMVCCIVHNDSTGNDVVLYSSDGITWSEVALDGTFDALVFSEELSKFVAIGSSGSITSTDGISWSSISNASPLPTSNVQYRAACWNPSDSRFHCIGYNSDSHIISEDGVTWEVSNPLPSVATWISACFASNLNKICVISETDGKIAVSNDSGAILDSDPIFLDSVSLNTSNGNKIIYAPGLEIFCAIYTSKTDITNRSMLISVDGKRWRSINPFSPSDSESNFGSICYNAAKSDTMCMISNLTQRFWISPEPVDLL